MNSKDARRSGSICIQALVWLLPLVLASLLAFVLWLDRSLQASGSEFAEKSLQSASQLSSELVQDWFAGLGSDLEHLAYDNRDFVSALSTGLVQSGRAADDYVETEGWSSFVNANKQSLMRFASTNDYIDDIFVLDVAGNILFSASSHQNAGTNIFDGNYIGSKLFVAAKNSLKHRQLAFSDVESDAVRSHVLNGYLSVPVMDSRGKLTGLLVLHFHLGDIQNLMLHLNQGTTKHYLIGTDNKFRISLDVSANVSDRYLDSDQIKRWNAARGSDESVFEVSVLEYESLGLRVIGLAQPLDIFGVDWLLVSEINKGALLRNLRPDNVQLLMLVTGLIGFWVFITFLVLRKLSRSLTALTIDVWRVAEGKLNSIKTVSADNEIGRLSDVLARLINIRDVHEQSLADASRKAEAACKAKSEFLACMSHEIRTPMNGVLGMLGILQNTQLAEDQQRNLKVAVDSAESLMALISDILDFSKAEAGKLKLESLEFLLKEPFVDVAHTMGPRAREKNLDLLFDISAIDTTQASGDPSRLRQILINLVDNAIKFTEEGEVKIVAELNECDGRYSLRCSVQDSGIGIPLDEQNHLFDSFTQLDATTTRKYGGTGLGLAICKQLCLLMDGDIWVESTEGKGSTFTFAVDLDIASGELREMPSVDLSGKRVLIVDNLDINREIFRAQLEQWGMSVTEAKSSDAAMEICSTTEDEHFDIALIDSQLPHMDGIGLAKTLIERGLAPQKTKLLLIGSAGYAEEVGDLSNIGFSGYLVKPIMRNELHGLISVVLDTKTENPVDQPLVTRNYLESLTKRKTGEQKIDASNADFGKVLVVEDNTINQEVIQLMISDFGFISEVAENGEHALALLVGAPSAFSLIFMDCQMPVMDGYETTKKIREGYAGAGYRDTPIVALTANAMKGDKQKCLDAGMTDYISKPIDPGFIEAALTKYVVKGAAVVCNINREVSNISSREESVKAPAELIFPPEVEAINFEVRRPAIARKPQLFVSVLKTYINKNNNFAIQAREYFESGKMDELRNIVHSIKGVSGNLGMLPLQESAARVEDLIVNDDVVDSLVFEDLVKQAEISFRDAELIISSNSMGDKEKSYSRYYSDIKKELIDKLEKNMVISVELTDEFKQAAVGELNAIEISKITERLDYFDYDQALEMLKF